MWLGPFLNLPYSICALYVCMHALRAPSIHLGLLSFLFQSWTPNVFAALREPESSPPASTLREVETFWQKKPLFLLVIKTMNEQTVVQMKAPFLCFVDFTGDNTHIDLPVDEQQMGFCFMIARCQFYFVCKLYLELKKRKTT